MRFMCLKEGYIRMVVMCDANDVIEYDIKTQELSNALLHMKHDANSTEQYREMDSYIYILDLDLDLDLPVLLFLPLLPHHDHVPPH